MFRTGDISRDEPIICWFSRSLTSLTSLPSVTPLSLCALPDKRHTLTRPVVLLAHLELFFFLARSKPAPIKTTQLTSSQLFSPSHMLNRSIRLIFGTSLVSILSVVFPRLLLRSTGIHFSINVWNIFFWIFVWDGFIWLNNPYSDLRQANNDRKMINISTEYSGSMLQINRSILQMMT